MTLNVYLRGGGGGGKQKTLLLKKKKKIGCTLRISLYGYQNIFSSNISKDSIYSK